MITSDPVNFPNVKIISIQLAKYSGKSYEIFSQIGVEADSYISFDEIVIEENMFGGSVFGSINFYDSSQLIEQFNASSFDSIIFKIDIGIYKFRILDIQPSTDLATKEIHGPAGQAILTTIRFTSDEFLYRNFDVQPLANFIGKISKYDANSSGNAATSNIENAGKADGGSSATSVSNSTDESGSLSLVQPEDEESMKGFVQVLVEAMSGVPNEVKTKASKNSSTPVEVSTVGQNNGWSKKPLVADETYNDIWIQPNPFFYPFSKIANSARYHQLINYICEYSCLKNTPTAVDFFFWEDLDKWNFRSVTSLASKKSKGTYVPVEDTNQGNAIISMEVISELQIANLINNGALFSEYVRVVPDWGNPYRGFLDTGKSLKKTHITYNYTEDIKKPLIAAYPPINDRVLKDIQNNPIPYNTNRLSDTNYGYYADAYNTKNTPWWNFYNYMTEGFTGERMAKLDNIVTEEDLLNKTLDVGEQARLEQDYWQAQFDFSESPGSILRKVYKEIKWPLTKFRKEYAELKNLKNQWSVYKKNICCEREVPLNFFALLTSAEKIYGGTGGTSSDVGLSGGYDRDSGGIYSYNWVEIEFWPKDAGPLIDINAETKIRKGITAGWSSSKSVIEFEDPNFPFVFLAPSHALIGQKSELYSGTTFNTPDTRAYNLNEVLNSAAPSSFEDGYQTLLMNPGITDLLGNTLADRTTLTNYPSKTSMMPVGKFRIISDHCPIFSNPGTGITATNKDGTFYFGGRIVQMSAIPKEMLQAFTFTAPRQGITGQYFDSDYMFIFDSENAHDGVCSGDNCVE